MENFHPFTLRVEDAVVTFMVEEKVRKEELPISFSMRVLNPQKREREREKEIVGKVLSTRRLNLDEMFFDLIVVK